uniref:Cadherin domain-containing protein n=1 Tax=Glossina morsitans morsitans TaxID=37546 RepID=A0A1B0FBX4_GLOMM
MHLFHEMTFITTCGQSLDILNSNESVSTFTMDTYKTIAANKTSNYAFYLPIAAATHLAALKDAEALRQSKMIAIKCKTISWIVSVNQKSWVNWVLTYKIINVPVDNGSLDGATFGYPIMKIEASDADSVVKAEIRFKLLSEPSRLFGIEEFTGKLRLISNIESSDTRIYGFDVKATDRAETDDGLSSIANVFVYNLIICEELHNDCSKIL